MEKKAIFQFTKFCFVGGIATIVNLTIFYALYRYLNIDYNFASALGYICGVFIGFIFNKKFTFHSKSKSYTLEITKYFIIYFCSLVIGLIILNIAVRQDIPVVMANLLMLAFTTIMNYFGSKFFVFSANKTYKNLNFLIYRYRYLINYILIGLSSIILEIVIIQLAIKIINIKLVCIALGFISGVILSFWLNAKINFNVPKEKNLRTFRIFFTISIFSFYLNLLIMNFLQSNPLFSNYSISRLFTSACVFMVSYTLHRRFTFVDIKEVGVAIYLNESENIKEIKSKVMDFPDFIHIDLIDASFNNEAQKVNIKIASEIREEWPNHIRMIHIMSKHPSFWIKKLHNYVDFIIFHAEIEENIPKIIKLCKHYNKKVGLSIFYNTPIEKIKKYLEDIDIVQVLGIQEPGRSSQHMIVESIQKIEELNSFKKKYNFDIGFDGGVKLTNIHKIKTKYVTSASTILKSDNAIKALYNLKTSSRYYYDRPTVLKEFIKKKIFGVLEKFNFIISATLVGSFVDKDSIEGISDIDIVIILDKLRESKYKQIINVKLKEILLSDYDLEVVINDTFGPLKYTLREGQIVFHIMIYDILEHIRHVINSPFTCLDWERSDEFIKSPMSSIYNVRALYPYHFFNARRGIKDYCSDLALGKTSFKKYKFTKNGYVLEKKHKKMVDRDKIEFGYHVMKFIMINFLKFYYKQNKTYEEGVLTKKYFEIFPLKGTSYSSFFRHLYNSKKNNIIKWRREDSDNLMLFVKDFEHQFNENFIKKSTKIYFLRHFQTNTFASSFLGQRGDPPIIPPDRERINKINAYLKDKKITHIISSPLTRCVQTIERIKDQIKIKQLVLDDSLKEIDYGLVEGKDYGFLKENYATMIKKWERGEDPKFPGGENYQNVLDRIETFFNNVKDAPENYLVCTHNVVLRCIIGSLTKTKREDWHKLFIPFAEPIEVIVNNKTRYLNLSKELEEEIFKNLIEK